MCNCMTKAYPDGSQVILAAERPIFRRPGWEERRRKPSDDLFDGAEPVDRTANVARAQRRARSRVFDLAMSNDFTYFVTFTLDRQKVDRYDAGEITRRLNSWLDNRVRRSGLAYVLVPERHKDGAIHFHGLINDALPVTPSGTFAHGGDKPRRPRSAAELAEWREKPEEFHEVFNLPAWSLGFSTAIPLYGSRAAACGYVCKYISKAPEKIGGRWYYSGGALRGPVVTFSDVDFDAAAAGGQTFTLDGLGVRCVKVNNLS